MKRTHAIVAVATAALGVGLLELHKARFERAVTGGKSVSAVSVTRDVSVGHRLAAEDFEVREMPVRFAGRRQVRGSDVRELVGARVKSGLKAGDRLLYDDLALGVTQRTDLSSLVPDGLRALSIAADAFDGLLEPGDRVDVLLSEPGGLGKLATVRSLVQGALVLAVGGSTSPDADQVRSGSVVIAATVEQAATLAAASGAGSMTLALRNPADLVKHGATEFVVQEGPGDDEAR